MDIGNGLNFKGKYLQKEPQEDGVSNTN